MIISQGGGANRRWAIRCERRQNRPYCYCQNDQKCLNCRIYGGWRARFLEKPVLCDTMAYCSSTLCIPRFACTCRIDRAPLGRQTQSLNQLLPYSRQSHSIWKSLTICFTTGKPSMQRPSNGTWKTKFSVNVLMFLPKTVGQWTRGTF